MSITIEKAFLTSIEALYDIERKSFGEEAFTRSQIATLLTDPNTISFAASLNGEIVGFIIALVEVIRRKPSGHIITIDVTPQHRRIGIGKRLLDAVEVQLRSKGVDECCLEVREDNMAALALYAKKGYAKVGRLEKYYGMSHGLYLRKRLMLVRSIN